MRPLSSPATTRPRSTLLATTLLLAACIVAAGIATIQAGQDANWDLQNYHFYNPWAWLGGRIFGPDLAAAQLQTFHNPLFDVPFYAMVAHDWPPRAIAFALAVPTGFAAFFLILLARLLFADLEGAERHVAIASSLVIGVTSSMGRATLGTTMNEWILAALVLAGLWLVVRTLVRPDLVHVPRGALVAAGLLVGIATGGKLTAGSFAVAICAALVLRGPFTWRATMGRCREAVHDAERNQGVRQTDVQEQPDFEQSLASAVEIEIIFTANESEQPLAGSEFRFGQITSQVLHLGHQAAAQGRGRAEEIVEAAAATKESKQAVGVEVGECCRAGGGDGLHHDFLCLLA